MGAASAPAPRSRATPAANLPRIGLPLTWTKKENIRIADFAPRENELPVWLIRSVQAPEAGTAPRGEPECTPDADPLQAQAAQAFAGELAAAYHRASDPRPAPCGSAAPSGCAHTCSRSTARKRACPSNIRLSCPGVPLAALRERPTGSAKYPIWPIFKVGSECCGWHLCIRYAWRRACAAFHRAVVGVHVVAWTRVSAVPSGYE